MIFAVLDVSLISLWALTLVKLKVFKISLYSALRSEDTDPIIEIHMESLRL